MIKNRPKYAALKYSVLKPNKLVTSMWGTFRPSESGNGFEVGE
jgi:hypothetical protein